VLIQRTRSGGYHIVYRCEKADGNRKLTSIIEGGLNHCVIETRGEGGYFLAAPTQGYELLQGSFEALPFISNEERAALFAAALSLDEKATATAKAISDATKHVGMSASANNFDRFLGQCFENATNQVRHAGDGYKHTALLKAAYILGGYVGGGLLAYNEAERLLWASLEGKAVLDTKNAGRTIADGLAKGASKPITAETKQNEYFLHLAKKAGAKTTHSVQKYLSESTALEAELFAPNGCGLLSIEAPTGSGKTRTIIEALHTATQRLNRRAVIVLPYRALPSQIASEYARFGVLGISGGASEQDVLEARNSRIVAVTYDSINKIVNSDYPIDYLVIDESHNLVNQYDFRNEALNKIQAIAFSGQIKSVLLISATPCQSFPLLGVRKLVFTRASNPNITLRPLTYKDGNALDVLTNQLSVIDFSRGLVAVKVNSKESIHATKQYCIQSGLLEAGQIATIYDHSDIETDPDYTAITETSKVREGVRLLLTTSKINDGVNILNTDVQKVFVIGEKCVDSLIQFVARFRAMDALDVTTIRKADKANSDKKDRLDVSRLAKTYLAEGQAIADALNRTAHEEKKLGLPKERIMKSANDFVMLEGETFKLNRLACLSRAKAETDGALSLYGFYATLAERAPYISVQQETFTTPAKEPLTEAIKEARKAEKEAAFNSGLSLISEGLKMFLSAIWAITKDIALKAKIAGFLGYEPTKTPEFEAYMSQYGQVLKLANVQRIGEVFLRLVSFGFSNDAALSLIRLDKFTSPTAFSDFANQLAYHAAAYIMSQHGESLLPYLTRREIKLLEGSMSALKELGATFTAKDAKEAVNHNRRNFGDRLDNSGTAKLISYTLETQKEKRGKERTTCYDVLGVKDFEGFMSGYGLNATDYKAVIDGWVSAHREAKAFAIGGGATTDNEPLNLPYKGYCGVCGF
jgi:hypothetical protein